MRAIESLVIAAWDGGRISLCRLRPDASISTLAAPGKIRSVSPHPSKPLLGVIDDATGKLLVLRFDGSLEFDVPAPELEALSPDWVTSGYGDCHFDESGTHLWCAASVAENKAEVQLWETCGWSLVSRSIVEDEFGGSVASFHPTGIPGTLSLWLAAGQDGQCVYWVTRDDDRFRCTIEPSLHNTLPPVFSPGGPEFLVVGDFPGAVRKFRHPNPEPLGSCASPFGEEDPFSTSLCYLDETWALADSHNNRIALVDTSTLRFVKEVVIESHEPRPVEAYYPTLAGDRQLCTDILYFDRAGDDLVIVYRLHHPLGGGPDRGPRFEEWRDGLLCFPVSYVLDRERD